MGEILKVAFIFFEEWSGIQYKDMEFFYVF